MPRQQWADTSNNKPMVTTTTRSQTWSQSQKQKEVDANNKKLMPATRKANANNNKPTTPATSQQHQQQANNANHQPTMLTTSHHHHQQQAVTNATINHWCQQGANANNKPPTTMRPRISQCLHFQQQANQLPPSISQPATSNNKQAKTSCHQQ